MKYFSPLVNVVCVFLAYCWEQTAGFVSYCWDNKPDAFLASAIGIIGAALLFIYL